MKVAILGCGPAGLMAAHAVALHGHEPIIFSKKVPSSIGGAQYLHCPIPRITGDQPDGLVNFIKYGNEQGYAKKVYDDPYAVTSWYDYEEGMHPVWNLRKAYEKLWKKYEDKITDVKLHYEQASLLCKDFSLVMNTVPLNHLCGDDHHFDYQDVWIVYGQLGDRGENRIVYDGTQDFPWYRWSYIFGWTGIEYSQKVRDGVHIRKPLVNVCDCLPGMVRLGRYGAWQKGILTHHAYEGAVNALQQMQ